MESLRGPSFFAWLSTGRDPELLQKLRVQELQGFIEEELLLSTLLSIAILHCSDAGRKAMCVSRFGVKRRPDV